MNRRVLSNVFLFALGASVGSLVTWKLMDEKYKQLANQEIESMREYYKEKYEDNYKQPTLDDVIVEAVEEAEEEFNEHPDVDEEEVAECENIAENAGYTNYADMVKINKEVENVAEPYVISPDDFAEIREYKAKSLIYFSDGVLTDNEYEPIEDVDNVVGFDSLDHFGDYEDDSVHVRNDRLKTDFEILLDPRKYADFINNDSHPAEDE